MIVELSHVALLSFTSLTLFLYAVCLAADRLKPSRARPGPASR